MDHETYRPQTFSISVKGVVVRDGKVLLLRTNARNGNYQAVESRSAKPPKSASPERFFEETQWKVETGPILDTWMYYINVVEKHVFIVTYGCHPIGNTTPVLSHEHKEVGLFSEDEVPSLVMPDGYKRSIATWYARLRDDSSESTK